jgi:N-acetylglutamate synthase-like GNAT family acetyltransferase
MITIRRAQHNDAPQIIDAHVRSIREVCSKDYTSEQIAAWSGRNFRAQVWCRTIDRDFVWVVEVNSTVRGFSHLAFMDEVTAEIMGFYFTPEARGSGTGKKLFQMMKEEAFAKGVKKLQLNATLTAKPFYESCGFQQSGSDTSIEMRGVPIPCIPMECIIL